MMFGLPGAALAMYLAAPKARRPMVGGMLLSVAITAFLTGSNRAAGIPVHVPWLRCCTSCMRC